MGTRTCKHCGRRIRWSHSGWWYHIDENGEYRGIECDTFTRQTAQPQKETGDASGA